MAPDSGMKLLTLANLNYYGVDLILDKAIGAVLLAA